MLYFTIYVRHMCGGFDEKENMGKREKLFGAARTGKVCCARTHSENEERLWIK